MIPDQELVKGFSDQGQRWVLCFHFSRQRKKIYLFFIKCKQQTEKPLDCLLKMKSSSAFYLWWLSRGYRQESKSNNLILKFWKSKAFPSSIRADLFLCLKPQLLNFCLNSFSSSSDIFPLPFPITQFFYRSQAKFQLSYKIQAHNNL